MSEPMSFQRKICRERYAVCDDDGGRGWILPARLKTVHRTVFPRLRTGRAVLISPFQPQTESTPPGYGEVLRFGAGSGIRTHAPFPANGFQDHLVMTASISLHILDLLNINGTYFTTARRGCQENSSFRINL